jgi:cell filamentation protein, protein adenylyltransferase
MTFRTSAPFTAGSSATSTTGPDGCGPSPSRREACSACPQYIESAADEIFRRLRHEDYLRGLERDGFVDRLAYYFGEVNAVHPFREGNGRAQRAFLEQLASDAGFTLAWQHLDGDRNIAASAAIMRGDPIPMRTMLDELVQKR